MPDFDELSCSTSYITAELEEIMSLSDRIGVVHDGRLMEVLPSEQVTREQLGLLMTGVDLEKEG